MDRVGENCTTVDWLFGEVDAGSEEELGMLLGGALETLCEELSVTVTECVLYMVEGGVWPAALVVAITVE